LQRKRKECARGHFLKIKKKRKKEKGENREGRIRSNECNLEGGKRTRRKSNGIDEKVYRQSGRRATKILPRGNESQRLKVGRICHAKRERGGRKETSFCKRRGVSRKSGKGRRQEGMLSQLKSIQEEKLKRGGGCQ